MAVVDVHHHFVPEATLDRLRTMAGGKPRLVTDRISVSINPDLSDVDAHVAAMDEAGIDVAVLTQSQLTVLGSDFCRELNEGIADVAGQRPDRFVATAQVNIDDPGVSAELERCVSEYHSGAVALQTSSPERELDDPSLEGMWSTIEEMAIPVILHPPGLPKGASTDFGLERSCYRTFDTTTAAVRILNGILPKHPGLRVLLPHCGGTTVALRGRMAMFFNRPGATPQVLPRTIRQQRAEDLDAVFDELWAKFYFDTAGTGGWVPIVDFTVDVVGCDHLTFGTDFPMEAHSGATMRELVEMVEGLSISPQELEQVMSKTALTLLGEPLQAALSSRESSR